MRFIVCGAGAVGGVLGGQLAKAGYAVVYIEPDPAHRHAMAQGGLRLSGVHGQHRLAVPVVARAAEIDFRDGDVLVLAVKSFHTAAAVAALRRATDRDLPLFCAQNGVRNEAISARFFPDVHGMMVLTGAKRLQPGEIVQTGNGPLGIGTYPAGISRVASAVATALEATDLPVYTTANIQAAKWNKLLLNLNNATLGLIGCSVAEAYADQATRQWMADVWEEGWRVLHAAGIMIEGPPGMGTVLERIRELRAGAALPPAPQDEAAKAYSSLWQDLFHRRGAVEADALNGEIVRLGRQYHVPTPYNGLLWERSNATAAARVLPGVYTLSHLRSCCTPTQEPPG